MVNKLFIVLSEIEMPDGMHPIEPPLECEYGKRADGWYMECDMVRVAGCSDFEDTICLFEDALRGEIVGGRIKILGLERPIAGRAWRDN